VKLPEPRLHLVQDPEDAPATTRGLHALCDINQGVVAVRVTPGPRQLHWIARDVLSALGKDHNRSGVVRNAEENWRRCASWLVGEHVRHLIVDRAETLRPNGWQDFVELAAQCRLTLWLIVHAPLLTRGQREFCDDWPIAKVTLQDFLAGPAGPEGPACRRAQPAPEGPSETATAFPTVQLPRSDFTTFRADCRRLLSPDVFQRVDVEMRDAAARTRRWLDTTSCTEEAAVNFLQELIQDCPVIGQALARLRAAQAVSLMHGLLVSVDLERLMASTGTPRPAIDRHLVKQLRAYSGTQRAAAALAVCVTGASPQTISRLNIADTQEHEVHVDGKRFAVPEIARGILAAHLHSRASDGARDGDPFFSNPTRGEVGTRSTPRVIRQAIDEAARESGLILWGEYNTLDDIPRQRWLHRRGVSVQAIR